MRKELLKIKSVLIIAGSGFIFSLMTGLFSGNPFSVILFRSCIGALFFTAIVAAAVFVIKKTLPEINELLKEENSGDDGEIPGEKLDIVIEDENPYDQAASDSSEEERIDEDTLLQKDFIEEVEEESIDDIGILEQDDDSDEVIEVMDDSISNGALPELDENISFVSGSSESTDKRDNDAVNKLGGNIDPGTMAKAIKTILKKDQ